VTCIDYGTPMVMIRAQDLGRSGYENPGQIDADSELKARLESIRLQAGRRMNLGDVRLRNVPKMCLLAAAQAGGTISTRTFLKDRCHTSINVVSAICVAVACLIQGSAPRSLADVTKVEGAQILSVEHPTGELTAELHLCNGQSVSGGLIRTARLLFDGKVCIPRTFWRGQKDTVAV